MDSSRSSCGRRIRAACLPGLALLALAFGSSLRAQDDAQAQIADLQNRVNELEKRAENPLVGIDSKGRPYIKSEDERFKIQLGTRLQLRYTYQAQDTGRAGQGTRDRSFGELERARLKFHGNFFSENLEYKIEADGHSDNNNLALTDAYLNYVMEGDDIGNTTEFGAGQWKPFFGRQEKTSSGKQLLVDRSLANEFFNIDRNIGVWVEGRQQLSGGETFSSFLYHFAVTNGFDSVNRNFGNGETDQVPAVIAHLDFDILGKLGSDALSSGDLKRRTTPGLTSGISFATDQNNGTSGNAFEWKIYQFALDTVFKYSGFNLNLEYFGRWLDLAGDGADALYTHGGYIESGYMLPNTDLQLVSRLSAVWDKEGGSGTAATEVAAGINYFFFGHQLKLSSDIAFLDIPAGMIRTTETFPGSGAALANFASSSANLNVMQGVMMRVQAQLDF